MAKTAVLVDGGFYRKRARHLWGEKSAKARADELNDYVFRHIEEKGDGGRKRELYRIFYYDCPPIEKTVYHPLLKKNIDFGKRDSFQWMNDFLDELKKKRKMALRLGRLSDVSAHFNLNPDKLKKLLAGKIDVRDLEERDFSVSFVQKGVDMKMGVDITSLAFAGIVNQIILISGDSDFVPAAKAARRRGIDFILDPMGAGISDDLFEHIDGKESFTDKDPAKARKQRRRLAGSQDKKTRKGKLSV